MQQQPQTANVAIKVSANQCIRRASEIAAEEQENCVANVKAMLKYRGCD